MRYPETGYIKYLTVEEFQRIEEYVNKTKSPSMRMCVQVMMYLGLRVGEAVRLCRDDFTKDWSILFYRPLKKKKIVIHERFVPQILREQLMEYWQRWNGRIRGQFLFFPWANQSPSKHICRESVEYFFTKLRRNLKLEDIYYVCKDGKKLYRVSPHTLRHYALWRYYEASGRDLVAVKQMICHESVNTTAKYINALKSAGNEKDIVEKAFGK